MFSLNVFIDVAMCVAWRGAYLWHAVVGGTSPTTAQLRKCRVEQARHLVAFSRCVRYRIDMSRCITLCGLQPWSAASDTARR